MATAWITYAWQDNQANDVTFIALELERMGIKIKLDRWNIQAGHRLWEQIDRFITDPKESDAWILFATANSLGSEACKEEFSYALSRSLNNRGDGYPIIALFPGTADNQLIPAGIRSRLYISLTEPHWKERILSSIEGRSLSIPRPKITPYVFRVHTVPNPRGMQYALEMRPRANSWFPFFVAVPANEKDEIQCSVCHYLAILSQVDPEPL